MGSRRRGSPGPRGRGKRRAEPVSGAALQNVYGLVVPVLASVILYRLAPYRRWCEAAMRQLGGVLVKAPPLLLLVGFFGVLVLPWLDGEALDWLSAALVAWAVAAGSGLMWLGASIAGDRDSHTEAVATLVVTAQLVAAGLAAMRVTALTA